MKKGAVDLDLLATHLKTKMATEHLAIRAAAEKIGCSSATLGRLLHGAKAPNVPDSVNLLRAANWLGRGLDEFIAKPHHGSTLADVEVHLRALPSLSPADAEAIVAMVKAAYGARIDKTKSPRR
jgi:transcriptional regulator with XRE-family HTH domain